MDRPFVSFLPAGAQPESPMKYAIIAARCDGQWLFCRHKQRATWEIPGGHIEPGETPLCAAHRELREETGAIDYTLTPVAIADANGSSGLLCLAEVRTLGPLDPDVEIGEVARFAALPQALTYPLLQPPMFEYVQGWLNLQSSPDEIWDVYDAQRRLTGRTHRRGDPLVPGDYHLVVHAFVRRPSGEFLITQRAPTKGYPLMWEYTGGSAEAGEDSVSAALRELREETGLRARPEQLRLLFSLTGDSYHADMYLVTMDFDLSDVTLLAGETVDKRLATKEEILSLQAAGQFVPFSTLERVLEMA